MMIIMAGFKSTVTDLFAFCPSPLLSEVDERLQTLCPSRIPSMWSSPGRQTAGKALSEQVPPEDLTAFSVKSAATSWDLLQGDTVEGVCAAASWTTQHTFGRLYSLAMMESVVAHSVSTIVNHEDRSLVACCWVSHMGIFYYFLRSGLVKSVLSVIGVYEQ